MTRPTFVSIDYEALRHNLRVVRQHAHDRTLWAVVKANAYGHGLEHAVACFHEADGLASLDAHDGILARQLGWKKRFLVLEGFFDADELTLFQTHRLEAVIHSHWQIELIERTPLQALDVHLKLNTGMNRLGFDPEELSQLQTRLSQHPGVVVKGVMTHFANADIDPHETLSVPHQVARFEDAGLSATQGCLANSAALLWHPEALGQAVRVGGILYGLSPRWDLPLSSMNLKPVMRLNSQIIAVKHLEAGQRLEGSAWVAERTSRLGVVACGYADGYPRTLKEDVLIDVQGTLVPLVGNVHMHTLCVDLTDLPTAGVGSSVQLWGDVADLNALAHACGTIVDEIVCGVSPRLPTQILNA